MKRELGTETGLCSIEHATWTCTMLDNHEGPCGRASGSVTDRQTAAAVEHREKGS